MMPWKFKQWLPANTTHCRRELIAALDLIAACIIAQLFLDHWLAELVSQFHRSSVVQTLRLLPDRVQLSLLFTLGMMLLLAYRVASGDRARTDRGMFILGCGVVAGFVAAKLKLIFGRSPPDVLLSDGDYGFHFLMAASASIPSLRATQRWQLESEARFRSSGRPIGVCSLA
jgi:hypothetical protein